MLVLGRKKGEQIVIANQIVVTVIDVRHDRIRLGIDAPVTIPVHREEIFKRISQSELQDIAIEGRITT